MAPTAPAADHHAVVGSVGRVLCVLCAMASAAGCSLIVAIGGDDQDGASAPCGTFGAVQDSFAGGELAEHWIPSMEGSDIGPTSVSSGRLRIDFRANANGSQVAGVETVHAYDLRGEPVTLRVYPDAAATARVELFVVPARGQVENIIRILIGEEITAYHFVAGVPDMLGSAPYNPDSHAYVRIREIGGHVDVETRGETGEFMRLGGTGDVIDPLDTVVLILWAELGEETPVDGAIEFGELNLDATAVPACSIGTLQDDFTDDALQPQWRRQDDPCVSLQPGAAIIEAPALESCVLYSAHAYSLTAGAPLVLNITQFPVDPATFELTLDRYGVYGEETGIRLSQQGESLFLIAADDGDMFIEQTLSNAPTSPQWWKIEEVSGDVEFSISSDGSDFDMVHRFELNGRVDLSTLGFQLVVHAATTEATAELGGINVDP